MSTAALATGSALAALFLVATTVLLVSCLRSSRHEVGQKMGFFLCWSVVAAKKGRDLEKGQTTARVADGPELPAQTKIKREEPKKAEVVNVPTVRKFGWREVEDITERFSSAVIGQGGSSTVYLARLGRCGIPSLGAVKVHHSGSGSERLLLAFRRELEVLLNLYHPYIVRLLGFCDDREEGVLVLEYVSNGTLHEKLHGCPEADSALPWGCRMNIALQLARAVEHLHDGCALPIVHCDLKASNILLDERLDCRLCDFGSACVGFESAVAKHPTMMGSPGYVDPHYLRTGIVSKKGDVYSFGILLLELLTGIEAFCAEKGQILAATAGRAPGGGELAVDQRLGNHFDAAEATAVAALAARCITGQPSLRPSMAEVVKILEAAQSNSISTVQHKLS